ncbi:MAG: bifunctional pyr operon transcriptional regulator/uracil phosphoribosyltransferase PyrR [Gammaproteobacteria bacterium]|nr:bifunctional pyr operon transcriptional regulator/uracil phosphoribosyltransferase PyrR [Gammaproteobacteria bacterium]
MTKIHSPDSLIQDLSDQLTASLKEKQIDQPVMVGIHTGGAWVAERLHKNLNIEEPLATLNISFYRDDFSRIGVHPQVTPSTLPSEIEGRHIILVDDVLQTGRTIRAAMNELFDYGRPASITLVCLVERDGHELPIRADIVGQQLSLQDDEQIKLTGPEPLAFEIQQVKGQY